MEIRPATGADRDGLAALVRQLHGGTEGRGLLPDVRQDSRTFVSEHDGKLVGTVVVTFVDDGFEAYGMIEQLIVEAAHRAEGIGAALVEQARTWCFGLGADVVFVPSYPDAERFYRTVGFHACMGPWLYSVPGSAG
jgi:predicted N-acetyltransferase YhbS